MARKMLLYRRIERAAEIDSMLWRKHDFGNELASGLIRPYIGELQDDGVVRDRHLSGIGKRLVSILRDRYDDGIDVIRHILEMKVRRRYERIYEAMQPHAYGSPALMKKLRNK